ncbi:hypothetical protein Aduo_002864 [Ancylostoma duodenale]
MLEGLERVPCITTQPGTSNSESQSVVTRSREVSSEEDEDPGIHALDGVNEVTVRQRVRILELFTTIGMNNVYDVYTSSGKLLFSAHERSPCLLRFAYGRQHGLTLHVTDNDGQPELMVGNRYPLNIPSLFHVVGSVQPLSLSVHQFTYSTMD